MTNKNKDPFFKKLRIAYQIGVFLTLIFSCLFLYAGWHLYSNTEPQYLYASRFYYYVGIPILLLIYNFLILMFSKKLPLWILFFFMPLQFLLFFTVLFYGYANV